LSKNRVILLEGHKWVNNKFSSPKKQKIRERFNPKQNWRHSFVHGNVKDSRELSYIRSEGVGLLPFGQVLVDLCNKNTQLDFVGSSAGDLVEL
jgi:hypothetical protein